MSTGTQRAATDLIHLLVQKMNIQTEYLSTRSRNVDDKKTHQGFIECFPPRVRIFEIFFYCVKIPDSVKKVAPNRFGNHRCWQVPRPTSKIESPYYSLKISCLKMSFHEHGVNT